MATVHAAMVTGRRYTGVEAQAAGLVDAVVAHEAVLPSTVARAQAPAGKAGPTIASIKETV
ncbi:hypothetical protein [Actinokineospora sp. HUAS TT18]|uniref:hypothetical protein n=1 Tax=Actinokineospora sp. HUAS TT18 TaxID=3447451 RepID=UPI003F52521D